LFEISGATKRRGSSCAGRDLGQQLHRQWHVASGNTNTGYEGASRSSKPALGPRAARSEMGLGYPDILFALPNTARAETAAGVRGGVAGCWRKANGGQPTHKSGAAPEH
jgi:hypothetical protein